MKKLLFAFFLQLFFISTVFPQTDDVNTLQKIFEKPAIVKNDIIRFNFPRTDLNVKVGSVKIEPAFALTSWVAFQKMDNSSVAMGDLVLLEPEAAKVIPALVKNGITITAIHNHLLNEKPKIIYTHIYASGNSGEIAEKIKTALSLTKTPFKNPKVNKQKSKTDWSKVEEAIGFKGTQNGNVLSIGIANNETIKEDNMEMPAIMGTGTSINFQSAGKKAAVTGDFVLLKDEVIPVETALIKNGILVTALHTHMLNETPKLYFMHFWALNDPVKLAAGLKDAIMQANSIKK